MRGWLPSTADDSPRIWQTTFIHEASAVPCFNVVGGKDHGADSHAKSRRGLRRPLV